MAITALQILILTLFTLIAGSFIIRITLGALKVIYEAAPFIVIWGTILAAMFYFQDDLFPDKNKVRQDARDTKSVKD